MQILDVLRIINTCLCVLVGSHLAVSALTMRLAAPWSIGRPEVRFLRLGTGTLLLVLAYGTINAMMDGVRPSETTWLLTVCLLWLLGGTLWPHAQKWGRRAKEWQTAHQRRRVT